MSNHTIKLSEASGQEDDGSPTYHLQVDEPTRTLHYGEWTWPDYESGIEVEYPTAGDTRAVTVVIEGSTPITVTHVGGDTDAYLSNWSSPSTSVSARIKNGRMIEICLTIGGVLVESANNGRHKKVIIITKPDTGLTLKVSQPGTHNPNATMR